MDWTTPQGLKELKEALDYTGAAADISEEARQRIIESACRQLIAKVEREAPASA